MPALGILLAVLALMVATRATLFDESIFRSPNGRFELQIECDETAFQTPVNPPFRIPDDPPDSPSIQTCVARLFEKSDGNLVLRWKISSTNIGPFHRNLIVSDAGDFFVTPEISYPYDPGFGLFRRGKPFALLPMLDLWTEANNDILNSWRELTLAQIDHWRGRQILAVWIAWTNQWRCFDIETANVLEATPALLAHVNKSARQTILTKFEHAISQRRLHEFPRLAAKASEFVPIVASRPTTWQLMELDFAFLALARNFADRHWIDRLMEADPFEVPSTNRFMWICGNMYMEERYVSPRYHFVARNDRRIFADVLDAVWRNKADAAAVRRYFTRHNFESLFSAEPREYTNLFNLGKLVGVVALPAPIFPDASSHIRLYAIPDRYARGKWTRDSKGVEKLLCDVKPMLPPRYSRPVAEGKDSITFSFETLPVGKYRVKAIWDKRPPFEETSTASPGDYESIEAGPFEVRVAHPVNIALNCTNRIGDATYYQADDLRKSRQPK